MKSHLDFETYEEYLEYFSHKQYDFLIMEQRKQNYKSYFKIFLTDIIEEEDYEDFSEYIVINHYDYDFDEYNDYNFEFMKKKYQEYKIKQEQDLLNAELSANTTTKKVSKI